MDADPDDLVLCLGRGREHALVSARLPEQVFGAALATDKLAAAQEFIAEHYIALVDHWMDAIDLLRRLNAARLPQ